GRSSSPPMSLPNTCSTAASSSPSRPAWSTTPSPTNGASPPTPTSITWSSPRRWCEAAWPGSGPHSCHAACGLTAPIGTGPAARDSTRTAHVLHRHALDSLHHRRCARPGRAQRDAALAHGTARNLGRDQYPVFVWFPVLRDLLSRGRDVLRRSCAVADRDILAVAPAWRTQSDHCNRHD